MQKSPFLTKEWLGLAKDSYKLKAKTHIIQNGPELWKICHEVKNQSMFPYMPLY
jgi:hypothetical protein